MWKWAHFEKGNHLKQTSMCCRLGSTKSLVSFEHPRMWLKIGSDLDDEFPCISQVPLLGSSCFFCFWLIFGGVFVHLWKKMIGTFKFISFRFISRFQPFPPWLLEGFYGIWGQAHDPYVSVMQQARSIPLSPSDSVPATAPSFFNQLNIFGLFEKNHTKTNPLTPWVRPVFLNDSSNVCWAKKSISDDQITQQLWFIKSLRKNKSLQKFRHPKVSILPLR